MVDREHHIIVSEAEAGERADVVVSRRLGFVSRRVVRKLALRGHLFRNGRSIPPSTRTVCGQALVLRTSEPSVPERPTILAVTSEFVYADKQPGMHTHRLGPLGPPTLADAVARLHPECAEVGQRPYEAGAVHRLDFETTGVVVFARSETAYVAGRKAIQDGALKVYLACCQAPVQWPPTAAWVSATALPSLPLGESLATPPHARGWRVDAPLGRGCQRHRVAARADGRPARSWVVPLGQDAASGHWLVAVRLQTGARHQARVHLATVGLPIVGDPLYGTEAPGQALALHARLLDLTPLVAGTAVTAPLPPQFASAFASLQPLG